MTLTKKVLVLGLDGMDPNLTKKFVNEGMMPNTKELIQRGSAREDLAFLGSVPTITPPMWTTLATGSCPGSHGITCFWNQHPDKLDTSVYAMDSRDCKDEQAWNVTAEAGLKTLVWHWPGSSWPPTSTSENLIVVDGTQPGAVNFGCATTDWEKFVYASTEVQEIKFKPRMMTDGNGAGCIIEDLDVADDDAGIGSLDSVFGGAKESKNIMLKEDDGESAFDKVSYDFVNSPIYEPKAWEFELEKDAKEFVMLTSDGTIRRPCLILKGENGDYDHISIYKNKKTNVPLYTLYTDVYTLNCLDEVRHNDKLVMSARNMRILSLKPDGTEVRLYVGRAMDINNDSVWHPKALYHEIVDKIGYCPAISVMGGGDHEIVSKCVIPSEENQADWTAKAINYMIEEKNIDVVSSHLHSIDSLGHKFWYFAKERDKFKNDEVVYQEYIRRAYRLADNYIGEFLHLLDKEWTIFIVSDHGLITIPEEEYPLLGDAFGVNVRVLEALGYTVLQKDENGDEMREIDWSKTRAVAPRGGHIYINLKGRNTTGIVEPEDKYALEEQIINDLYNYRDAASGRRIIAIALRNKDAQILGMYGPKCGDIIYFLNEGFNRCHGDSLGTFQGYFDTSVKPIFIAAGAGIKENYIIERLVRQTELAPTITTLLGIRTPKDCEGGPLYGIMQEA